MVEGEVDWRLLQELLIFFPRCWILAERLLTQQLQLYKHSALVRDRHGWDVGRFERSIVLVVIGVIVALVECVGGRRVG